MVLSRSIRNVKTQKCDRPLDDIIGENRSKHTLENVENILAL